MKKEELTKITPEAKETKDNKEAKEESKKTKGFVMPHLFWIMLGILLVASILTYIIPAGNFARTEDGGVIPTDFTYLGHQTPMSPLIVLTRILDGLTGSGYVIWLVMVAGAMTGMVLATGAVDELMNAAIYKLKDKNENILISCMFILMVYLGGFGGTDALIAVVPIGVLFAKKMKLDPIVAMGVTTYGTLLGFGLGPINEATVQILFDVQVYGAFFSMFLLMNFFMLIGLYFLLKYVNKIRKDPTRSLMYSDGWRPGEGADVDVELKETKLTPRTIIIMTIYLVQYMVIIMYPIINKGAKDTFNIVVAVNLVVAIIVGFVAGFSFDRIGNEFAKGVSAMAFVGFVIGLARVLSIILIEGNIMDTMVYVLTRPLMSLPKSFATVGITGLVAMIDVFIPSSLSKATIMIPILNPILNTLGINPEIGVQAFAFGDGFTNLISPALGWTVGSCALAGVPFSKWFKWALPKVLTFLAIAFVIILLMTELGFRAF